MYLCVVHCFLTYIYTYIYTYTVHCFLQFIHVLCKDAHGQKHTKIYIYLARMHMPRRIHVCVCIYIYVCNYTYTHTHTHIHAHPHQTRYCSRMCSSKRMLTQNQDTYVPPHNDSQNMNLPHHEAFTSLSATTSQLYMHTRIITFYTRTHTQHTY
jgi:hypothetical protein